MAAGEQSIMCQFILVLGNRVRECNDHFPLEVLIQLTTASNMSFETVESLVREMAKSKDFICINQNDNSPDEVYVDGNNYRELVRFARDHCDEEVQKAVERMSN